MESCLNRAIFDIERQDIFDEVLAWLDLKYFMDEEVYLGGTAEGQKTWFLLPYTYEANTERTA